MQQQEAIEFVQSDSSAEKIAAVQRTGLQNKSKNDIVSNAVDAEMLIIQNDHLVIHDQNLAASSENVDCKVIAENVESRIYAISNKSINIFLIRLF